MPLVDSTNQYNQPAETLFEDEDLLEEEDPYGPVRKHPSRERRPTVKVVEAKGAQPKGAHPKGAKAKAGQPRRKP